MLLGPILGLNASCDAHAAWGSHKSCSVAMLGACMQEGMQTAGSARMQP